jgi:hypothetical protein
MLFFHFAPTRSTRVFLACPEDPSKLVPASLSCWDGRICRSDRQNTVFETFHANDVLPKFLISQDMKGYQSNAEPLQRGYKRASYK